MNIFLTGATGAIGRQLVPMLVSRGHRVTGTTRTPAKAGALQRVGAEAVVVEVLDREAVIKAVAAARPDVIVHESTALASFDNPRRFDQVFAMTNRLRTEGTSHLLEAALAAGVRHFVAQSYAGWPNRADGLSTEADPLRTDLPSTMQRTLAAIRSLESMVLGAADLQGAVLRYGGFYGPGTSIAPDGSVVQALRRRQFPVVGGGGGVWSLLHIEDAASATVQAIERGASGLYNVVDDEPAPVREWLPELARAAGAPEPRHVPAWLGRLFIGEAGVFLMTKLSGASNAKAKRELRWQPRWPSWRDGFRRGLSGNRTEEARLLTTPA